MGLGGVETEEGVGVGLPCHGQSVDQGQFQTKLFQAPKEMRTPRTTCLLPHEAVYCKLYCSVSSP